MLFHCTINLVHMNPMIVLLQNNWTSCTKCRLVCQVKVVAGIISIPELLLKTIHMMEMTEVSVFIIVIIIIRFHWSDWGTTGHCGWFRLALNFRLFFPSWFCSWWRWAGQTRLVAICLILHLHGLLVLWFRDKRKFHLFFCFSLTQTVLPLNCCQTHSL